MQPAAPIAEGQQYEEAIRFTQAQVEAFAALSGDHNPIHLDEAYAARTAFRRPIVHGFLAGSIFSKILGMHLPGEGTIYLGQRLSFVRPIYPGQDYRARVTVQEVQRDKRRATLRTEMFEAESGKLVLEGEAEVINKQRI
jgi:acyl dehydratase